MLISRFTIFYHYKTNINLFVNIVSIKKKHFFYKRFYISIEMYLHSTMSPLEKMCAQHTVHIVQCTMYINTRILVSLSSIEYIIYIHTHQQNEIFLKSFKIRTWVQ